MCIRDRSWEGVCANAGPGACRACTAIRLQASRPAPRIHALAAERSQCRQSYRALDRLYTHAPSLAQIVPAKKEPPATPTLCPVQSPMTLWRDSPETALPERVCARRRNSASNSTTRPQSIAGTVSAEETSMVPTLSSCRLIWMRSWLPALSYVPHGTW